METGTSSARPGIFKHANAIVSSLDLRYKFGVEQAHWRQPGRTIVTQLDQAHVGFFVDEILDVITLPTSGWGPLPALLPRGIFTRTLLLKERIHLYAEFQDLLRIPDSGYLRQYIQQLLETAQPTQPAQHAISNAQTSTAAQPRVAATTNAVASRQHRLAQSTPARSGTATSVSAAPKRAAATQASRTAPSRHHVSHTTTATVPQHTPLPARATQQRAPTRLTAAARATDHSHRSDQQAAPTKILAYPRANPTVTTSITTDTPTAFLTTQAPVHSSHQRPTDAKPAGRGLFVWLLLLTGSGIALWYGLGDDTVPDANPLLTSPAVEVTQAPSPLATVAQPVVAVTTHDAIPASTPNAMKPKTPERVLTQTAPTNPPVPTNKTVTPAQSTQTSPAAVNPATNHSEYHASIEQDPEGLTITLDVPADDPAFKQALPATDHSAEVVPEAGVETNPTVTATTLASEANTKPEPTHTMNVVPQSVEIIHIVVKGDTLWDIAKRYVNNPFRYPELARLSKIRNPDLIYPGNRVRIIKRQRQP